MNQELNKYLRERAEQWTEQLVDHLKDDMNCIEILAKYKALYLIADHLEQHPEDAGKYFD